MRLILLLGLLLGCQETKIQEGFAPGAAKTPTVAPVHASVSILTQPNFYTSSASGVVAFVMNPVTATAECSTDGLTYFACVSPISYSSIAEGPFSVTIRPVLEGAASITPTTATWTVDTIAPAAPVAALASAAVTSAPQVSITVSDCTGLGEVLVNEGAQPVSSALEWQSCSTLAGAIGYGLPAGDGVRTLKVWGKDQAGNVSTTYQQLSVTYTTAVDAPVITTPASDPTNGGNTVAVSGTCENDAVSVELYVNSLLDQTVSCTANAFSGTITRTTEGSFVIKAKALDNVANSSPLSNGVTWYRDTDSPSVLGLTFYSVGPTIATPYFSINISPESGGSPIKYFRYSETSTFADSNWLPYVNGTNLGVNVSYTSGPRTLYVWIKDAAGNRSDSPGTLNYTLSLGSYPVITSIIVANTATPSSPPTIAETTFNNTDTIYASWTGTSTAGLIASPFTLFHSIDGINWTAFGAAFGAVTPGATNASSTTAAYLSPYNSGQKFFVRIGITDSLGQTSYRTSSAVNTGHWQLLGGSSDNGLGGTATNARLSSAWCRGTNQLAYDQNARRLYFHDSVSGFVTYIDQATGKWLKPAWAGAFPIDFIAMSMVIDPVRNVLYVASRTNANIYKVKLSDNTTAILHTRSQATTCTIALDSNGDLYFCDSDTNISRLPINSSGNAGAPVTLVGDGSSGAPVPGSLGSASPLRDMSTGAIAVSKNDELYFQPFYSSTLYKLKKSDNTIALVLPNTSGLNSHGVLAQGRSSDEILTLMENSRLVAVNGVTGAVTTLAGNGGFGEYADGIGATASALMLGGEGLVASPDGSIYFVDGAYGGLAYYRNVRIRTIDVNGNIQTVAGSLTSKGHNVPLAEARFPTNFTMKYNPYNQKVYTVEESVMRTIDFSGPVPMISKIMGSGLYAAPTGSGSTSPMYYMELAFWDASKFALAGNSFQELFAYDGSNFDTGNHALNAYDNTAALSPCHGQNYLNCRFYWASMINMDTDGAGNIYYMAHRDVNSFFGRIFKIASNGTMTQIVGGNSKALNLSCVGVGCARETAISPYIYASWMGWSSTYGTMFLQYDDGTGTFYLSAVDNTNGELSTLKTFPVYGSSIYGLVYDGVDNFYYSAISNVYKLTISTGVITQLQATPFPMPWSITGAVVLPPGGDLIIHNNGSIYKYVP